MSAESTASIGDAAGAPVESYPKTPEQRRRLLDTIGRNGFLRELDMTMREKLVASMQMVECGPESAPLINEGEELGAADKWFVIERGAVESSAAADPEVSGRRVPTEQVPSTARGKSTSRHFPSLHYHH